MNVLSLFDGISCARVALDRASIKYSKYYASEIDKYAIQVAKKNFSNTIHVGDVQLLNRSMLEDVDLIIGGSPCQDLSIAKANRKGLGGERSGLFYEFVRLVNEIKPKYFILENVASMSNESKNIISKELFDIEPIMINASLVSAQNRKRLFWVGRLENGGYKKVDVELPQDKGIVLADILEDSVDEKYIVNISDKHGMGVFAGLGKKVKATAKEYKNDGVGVIRLGQIGNGGQGDRIYSIEGKSICLSANGGGRGAKTGLYYIDGVIRKLTPIECERLQGLPADYTEGVSDTQRYKCIGNAFNVDVVSHILTFLKRKK